MASITSNSKGHRAVQFMAPQVDGQKKRKTIRLGKCSLKLAQSFRQHVEDMVASIRRNAAIPSETLDFLARLDDELHGRVAAAGLCPPRTATTSRTLAAVIAEFKEKRIAKESTRACWKQAFSSLTAMLGDGFDFQAINAGHADDWRVKLIAAGKADATIRKRTRVIATLFNWAVRREYCDSKPFAHLPMANIEGRDKPYVPAAHALALIEQLPSAPWKLLVALSRFGGLRVPSEALALRWDHVNWENNRITVPVPKLAHIAGKATRVIPIFESLRPWLLAAFDAAEPGETRVIALPETTDAYLRKYVRLAIERAAIPVWTSMFHAMRASCETDLAARFPLHVVVKWIGHDIKVAQRNYLRVLNADFDLAATGALQNAVHGALQSAVQSGTVSVGQEQPPIAGQAAKQGSGGSLGRFETADGEMNQWASADSNQRVMIVFCCVWK
jgi:integrase